jgi:hypothetical protein
MNTVEDRVRVALRETGEEISPHSVPPLRLRNGLRRLPPIPGRWGGWLTPLAAAASVAAVVAASLAVSAAFHGHQRGGGPGPVAPSHGSPAGPKANLRLVPRYFVALTDLTQAQAQQAAVRSTVTGHTLATVTPPRPYNVFTWVSGAADDRTFVLAAQRWWHIGSGQAGMPAEERDGSTPAVFFRLTFDPHTRSARLTRLAVPGTIHASGLAGMAVSPDGTRLALDFRRSIEIVTLATGSTRTWTWPGAGWIGNWKPLGQIFSWSADGRYLEFQQWGGQNNETMHVRVLDTTAPGTSLTAARVILEFPHNAGTLVAGNTFLTPDGSRVATATTFYPDQRTQAGGYVQITEYSARTGKPVRTGDRFNPFIGDQEVLWAGPHGSALVISDPRGRKTQYGRNNILGVLVGNRFTPIPHGADEFIQIAW